MSQFSTKAGTLRSLLGRLKEAKIVPLVSFSMAQWRANPEQIKKLVHESFPSQTLIVRSSCHAEDGVSRSNAGAFLSIANVGIDQFDRAVNDVIASYGEAQDNDEVLVQTMLRAVVRSGVAFSHDPNTRAPYRMINWSEGSDTSEVTGGRGGRIWQCAARSPISPPHALAPIVRLIDELLEIFDNAPVDCEFAVTTGEEAEVLWLLQARPLVLADLPESPESQELTLQVIEAQITRGMQPQPFLMGESTVYGVMPDWNPAEIIGIRPKPLSLSLYRELVTDSTWAYQRHNYGYRNLRGHPLMPHFFGLPYIDVRLSFNSFIPADLDEGLAGRLVDYYINQLLAEPTLHDKVEFDIVFSCYTLDLPNRLRSLGDWGFSDKEQGAISKSLKDLTNRIIHPETGLWRIDAEKVNKLTARRDQLFASNAGPLSRIYWLLEDARRYGTLPFAGLARAGFVAIQILRSLVAVGIFSETDYDSFLSSISTVSGQLSRDRGALSKSAFLARYGHLRPGTYDIESLRYDEAPDLYFDWSENPNQVEARKPFSFTLPQMREIVRLLTAHGLNPDPVGLFNFLQAGIELRESSKFHFTRNLSDALALITDFGVKFGLSPEELAYCDISVFKEMHVAAVDSGDLLMRSIDQGQKRYAQTSRLSLPPLIGKPSDIWAFEWPLASPNFITQKRVTACTSRHEQWDSLAGAIVCIPNADPGFDWIFSHPIAGLITAWGGANSHMAIRAGELGLPAVIGAGEMLYRQWSSANRLLLDCASRRVEVLA